MNLFQILALIALFCFIGWCVWMMWRGSKKAHADHRKDVEEAIERARAATGWKADKTFLVDGKRVYAFAYEIEDGCLVLYRQHERHIPYSSISFYIQPVIRRETVEIFARDAWKKVTIEPSLKEAAGE